MSFFYNSILCTWLFFLILKKKKGPVILFSNGSEIAFSDMYITPQDYKSGVIPFDNLTKPTEAGLEVLNDTVWVYLFAKNSPNN
jgi:hypothetical protein